MSYKSNYLKYKLKYLNLKKKLYGGMEEAVTTPPRPPYNNYLQTTTTISDEKLPTIVYNLIKEKFSGLLEKFNHISDALSTDDFICIFNECKKNDENSERNIDDVLHHHIYDSDTDDDVIMDISEDDN